MSGPAFPSPLRERICNESFNKALGWEVDLQLQLEFITDFAHSVGTSKINITDSAYVRASEASLAYMYIIYIYNFIHIYFFVYTYIYIYVYILAHFYY